MITKDRLDIHSLAVAATYPDHLRWKAEQDAQVAKVRIFGDDYKVLPPRVFARLFVRSAINVEVVNVIRIWVKVSEVLDQLG